VTVNRPNQPWALFLLKRTLTTSQATIEGETDSEEDTETRQHTKRKRRTSKDRSTAPTTEDFEKGINSLTKEALWQLLVDCFTNVPQSREFLMSQLSTQQKEEESQ